MWKFNACVHKNKEISVYNSLEQWFNPTLFSLIKLFPKIVLHHHKLSGIFKLNIVIIGNQSNSFIFSQTTNEYF